MKLMMGQFSFSQVVVQCLVLSVCSDTLTEHSSGSPADGALISSHQDRGRKKEYSLNAMKSIKIRSGWKKDFFTKAMKNNVGWKKDSCMKAMKSIKTKIGSKIDSFVNAMKSIKIKVGWKKDSVVNAVNATKSDLIKIDWKKDSFGRLVATGRDWEDCVLSRLRLMSGDIHVLCHVGSGIRRKAGLGPGLEGQVTSWMVFRLQWSRTSGQWRMSMREEDEEVAETAVATVFDSALAADWAGRVPGYSGAEPPRPIFPTGRPGITTACGKGMVTRWKKSTDKPIHKRAVKALRLFDRKFRKKIEHIGDAAWDSVDYLQKMLEVLRMRRCAGQSGRQCNSAR